MSATAYQANPLKKNWWEVGTPGATDTLGGFGGNGITQLGTGQPGGQSAQGPWSDNSPVQGGQASGLGVGPSTPPAWVPFSSPGTTGGNAFGTTYTDPGGGWNPVSLLDARNGYDGTAVDGHYNAAADTAKWTNNGQPELDRARVWRWTMDDLKGDFSDPERVKQQFLTNVARLKRDYANTPGMTWAGSAFSGYDKFAQGGQGVNGLSGPRGNPNAKPGDPDWGGSVDYANPSQGSVSINGGGQPAQGGNVNPLPPYGQGAATGAAAAGVTAQPGGSVPPVPLPTVPPAGGGGTPGTGTSGAPAGAYYRADPSVAVTQFLQQHGVNIGDHGPFADFLRKMATGIATPAASILANNPNGQMSGDQLSNLPQMLSNLIYGNGGQVFGNLNTFADQSMGQFGANQFKGMDAGAVQSLLSTINALKTMGDNPYMQNFTQNALSDLFAKYKQADFTSMTPPGGAVGKSQNADWFLNPQNDPYGLFR